jgi:ABC-type transport system involved in multi-copper enzyme maturation permease subunit
MILQHFFKGCNALGGMVAVIFAMNAVAAEAQRGTLEIWLARPLSRRRLLLERWAAGAIWLSLPVFRPLTIPFLAEAGGAQPGRLLAARRRSSCSRSTR